jgi:hypothetical protein
MNKDTVIGFGGIIITVITFILSEMDIKWLPFLSHWKWIVLFITAVCMIYFIVKRSNKLLQYIFILLFGIFLGLNLYSLFSLESNTEKHERERVVILLPLAGASKDTERQDGAVQLLGVMNCLTSVDDNFFDNFEFVFIDHKNKYDNELKTKINSELKKGTKYFFSTMSKVNIPLSHYFCDTIYTKDYDTIRKGKNPILVCSVTSTPDISTAKNKVYRYYVRSSDEGDELCKSTTSNPKFSFSKVTSIFVDDAYGQGATKAFEERNGRAVSHIPLQSDSLHHIEEVLNENINKITKKNQAILIAHYGMGMDNIIKSLDRLKIFEKYKPTLLITSTFSNEDWQRPIKHILDKYDLECYSLKPDYQKDCTNKYKDDVKDFSYFSLTKFLKSINGINQNKKVTFDDKWRENKVPDCLNVNYDGNNVKEGDIGFNLVIYKYIKNESIDNN